jgi:hypothetical protein
MTDCAGRGNIALNALHGSALRRVQVRGLALQIRGEAAGA